MKKIFLSAAIAATILTSCSSDDDTNIPTNNDNQIEVPATYTFLRANESTVSFDGQTTRILMAKELTSALKENTFTELALKGMFEHTAGNTDFSDPVLNASSKNIHSKIAASKDYYSTNTTLSIAIKAEFDAWISDQATNVFPNWAVVASAGNAGVLQQLGAGPERYLNAKGLELNQAIAKGFIGGLMADQILNNYLSELVLDEGSNIENNNNKVTEAGKSYSNMEHKWDEAYGYLYGAEVDPSTPVLGADHFLNGYLKQVDSDSDFSGIAQNVFNAFKLGRAAIVANNYIVRDAQVKIIRKEISKVIAVRAVHYLQSGKAKLFGTSIDKAAAFHSLSEGFGFVYSLQFTRKSDSVSPYFSHDEVTGFAAELMAGNGFWDVTADTLDDLSELIASRFDFTVAEVTN